MPVFETSFLVPASLSAVAAFHRGTEALKQLTPPPVFVQLHHVEPLAEGFAVRVQPVVWPFPGALDCRPFPGGRAPRFYRHPGQRPAGVLAAHPPF